MLITEHNDTLFSSSPVKTGILAANELLDILRRDSGDQQPQNLASPTHNNNNHGEWSRRREGRESAERALMSLHRGPTAAGQHDGRVVKALDLSSNGGQHLVGSNPTRARSLFAHFAGSCT